MAIPCKIGIIGTKAKEFGGGTVDATILVNNPPVFSVGFGPGPEFNNLTLPGNFTGLVELVIFDQFDLTDFQEGTYLLLDNVRYCACIED